MPATVLNKANLGIGQLAKQFYPNAAKHWYGGGNTVSTLKTILILTTDKKSLEHSLEILQDVTNFITKLPLDEKSLKEVDIKKVTTITNNNLHCVTSMLNDIQKVISQDGAKIEIDDKNMISFISNMNEVKNSLQYVSDYIALVLEIKEVKKELEEGKGKNFDIDTLLEHLKAA